VQILRVDWPVYPRRAEHNTVAEDAPFAVRALEAPAGILAKKTVRRVGAGAWLRGVAKVAMPNCTYVINGSY
jgi:hypothetical protein